MKIGSKGEDVKKVQAALGLIADGVFGSGTEKAVKDWQAKNGLAADGIVGEVSLKKLFGDTQPTKAALDLSKLAHIIPDSVRDQVPLCAEKFQINTPLRLAHFLAQCAHESGDFKHTEENLNYSEEGLKDTFPKYFQGAMASLYARKPEKIANRVYAGRMGNGDELSGDGYLFRGRGYIQLTGRENYRAFSDSFEGQAVNIMNNPNLVATNFPLLSAAWFWSSRHLNAIADGGTDHAIITAITKKVNSGTIGLDDRIKQFQKFYGAIA